ncbi:hypothetical protein FNO01nite_25220 [Flavobacterium noncentrifugens]|uniref:Uncharacterized protein n=1 Tax=Flavobacterium noncentrifugens TaxID=1128970 RepID=A0A1G8ZSA8_9FLAO|nr:DUF4082 domain-containing protein [Flavobacterium noncentrifugens]GEP51850.1 hypothetical protein FNO01nite_25220 [Flavobacterium noncentrifugens]SDK17927.1 hypothetical protein SAMN04487935_2720 [Flavobacterium noncentrifugens]
MDTNFLNLKTNFLKLTLFACMMLPIVSCSSDDDSDVAAPENITQDPLSGYLQAAGFTKIENKKDSGDAEFGIAFTPTVNGKITSISAKIPDIHSGMRIAIWDKATATVLRTELIDVASPDVEVSKNITALVLTKDKEYMFTFNSNDWYNYSKPDASATSYPITVGDIKITNYGYINGTSQTIPNVMRDDYYAGDIRFKFQKD